MLPAFRPDKSFLIDTPAFREWIGAMEKAAEMEIKSYKDLLVALEKRIAFFNEMGCRASDHALEYCPFELANASKVAFSVKKSSDAPHVPMQSIFFSTGGSVSGSAFGR